MNSTQPHTAVEPTIAPQKSKKPVFLIAGLLVVLALAATVVWKTTASRDLAPEVTYGLIDGNRISTSSLKGKVVLINFWATSCVTCIAEMPKLVETHRKYSARGYETVAVAMSYDRADYVLNFVKTRGLPFKVAMDLDGNVAEQFNKVKVTPTTLLVDTQGRILRRWVGEPDFKQLHGLIEGALPS